MMTIDQHLGNGAAAGITAANLETVTAPMDPQDTGTGVDPQAARAETAVDIHPALTANPRPPQQSPVPGSPFTLRLGTRFGAGTNWSTGTGEFVYAGCFSQSAVKTQL